MGYIALLDFNIAPHLPGTGLIHYLDSHAKISHVIITKTGGATKMEVSARKIPQQMANTPTTHINIPLSKTIQTEKGC